VVLGQSSFALYMVHAPLWGLIQWASGSEASLEHTAKRAAFAGIVAASVALYKWVEAPVTLFLRQRIFGSAVPMSTLRE
jgi:peptidoglycan/LPS O-acetylase OafA/YrhL